MIAVASASEVGLLLHLLDQAYDKKAWHGPCLRGALRGLTAGQAGWRPGPRRHSVAEIVLHAAYWKYAVRRRLRGQKRGTFALKGSNWFAVPEPLTAVRWREHVALLEAEHRALRQSVADLLPSRLHEVPAGSMTSNAALIAGIAAHDLYHTGQVQLLKRLQADA
jgi:uncharacterized damage-inducible protein DinB